MAAFGALDGGPDYLLILEPNGDGTLCGGGASGDGGAVGAAGDGETVGAAGEGAPAALFACREYAAGTVTVRTCAGAGDAAATAGGPEECGVAAFGACVGPVADAYFTFSIPSQSGVKVT